MAVLPGQSLPFTSWNAISCLEWFHYVDSVLVNFTDMEGFCFGIYPVTRIPGIRLLLSLQIDHYQEYLYTSVQ